MEVRVGVLNIIPAQEVGLGQIIAAFKKIGAALLVL